MPHLTISFDFIFTLKNDGLPHSGIEVCLQDQGKLQVYKVSNNLQKTREKLVKKRQSTNAAHFLT